MTSARYSPVFAVLVTLAPVCALSTLAPEVCGRVTVAMFADSDLVTVLVTVLVTLAPAVPDELSRETDALLRGRSGTDPSPGKKPPISFTLISSRRSICCNSQIVSSTAVIDAGSGDCILLLLAFRKASCSLCWGDISTLVIGMAVGDPVGEPEG